MRNYTPDLHPSHREGQDGATDANARQALCVPTGRAPAKQGAKRIEPREETREEQRLDFSYVGRWTTRQSTVGHAALHGQAGSASARSPTGKGGR